MLFSEKDNPEEIFENIRREILRGALDKKHPFRYVVLGTYGHTGIGMRNVVLRKVTSELELYFFTDSRSKKVNEINHSNQVGILLYHPSKRIQIRIGGTAMVLDKDSTIRREFMSQVQGEGKKAYSSTLRPGKAIDSPNDAFSWDESLFSEFFEVMKVIPNQIEALQLNGMEHLRVTFNKEEGEWIFQWLVP